MQLAGPQRFVLGVGADAGAHHAPIEARRLLRTVDSYRVFLGAWRTEIIALATYGDDERIVTQHAPRNQRATVVIGSGLDVDLALVAIEAAHSAEAKTVVMRARVGEIFNRVHIDVQCARGDLVQMGLPDMRAGLVQERNGSLLPLAQRVPEAGGELQTAGAAADDQDPMQRFFRPRPGLRTVGAIRLTHRVSPLTSASSSLEA